MATQPRPEIQRRPRGDRTRQKLIAAARELFTWPGYLDTTTEQIVARAGLRTRGAFYHHFDDKRDLFRAVFMAVEQDMIVRATAASPTGDPLERLMAGLHGFLLAALEPEVQRIRLIDGMAILGWDTRREIEADTFAAVALVLEQAMADGIIVSLPSHDLAHLVMSMVEEAALLVANAADPKAALASASTTLDRLVRGVSTQE